METTRHRIARYLAVALICGTVGALFLRQQLAQRAAPPATEATAASVDLRVGAPVPAVVLKQADGTTFRLADARGKPVVLNFWASWCGPCREEMPGFEEASKRLGKDVLFVGVNATSSDSREQAIAFIDQMGVTFPIVYDESGSMAAAYGIRGLPATFFIDAQGVLRSKALGPVLKDRLREQLDTVLAPK